MQATSVKVQTAFRFDKELVRRLKIKAKKENRSLNNYVETVLMDIVYDEPNDETIEAINEVRSGKNLEKLDTEKFDEFVASLWYVGVKGIVHDIYTEPWQMGDDYDKESGLTVIP